jgi:3-phosphoshikimate 1-carboxyvinyltransferase
VELEGLEPVSAQPDAVFRHWAATAGGALRWEGTGEESVLVVEGAARRGVDADVDPAPDAALPLAALVAFAGGSSRLRGVARLREKESDRLAAAEDLLARAGASSRGETEADGETLLVDGPSGKPVRADFRAWGDHRVAMAAAVLALALPQGSTLDDPGVVSKSYPAFWSDWSSLVPIR